jgi:hypothetical protein
LGVQKVSSFNEIMCNGSTECVKNLWYIILLFYYICNNRAQAPTHTPAVSFHFSFIFSKDHFSYVPRYIRSSCGYRTLKTLGSFCISSFHGQKSNHWFLLDLKNFWCLCISSFLADD